MAIPQDNIPIVQFNNIGGAGDEGQGAGQQMDLYVGQAPTDESPWVSIMNLQAPNLLQPLDRLGNISIY